MNKEIEQWLNGVRDYDEGVALFIKYGGNRSQARVFQNTVARFAIKSLTYELTKLAKKTTSAPVAGKKEAKPTTKVQKQKDDISEVVGKVKDEIHNIWVKLSRQHLDLFETGEENTSELMAERVKIMAERTPLMERYNQLYEAKEAFFNGELDEQQLLAVINQEQSKENNKQPTDYSQLSDLELTKRIKAVKQVINRLSNQLLYQQNTVAKTENPMPDCPRRRDIEQRISVKKAELETLTDIARQRGLIK